MAAIAVVLYHYTTIYTSLYSSVESPFLLDFKHGNLGVQLFFIISGYVIYMTLTRSNSIGEFFRNRAIRLYPAYLVAVILTFVLLSVYPLKEVSIIDGLLNLTMFQGFMPGVSHVDGVYWTLTVEIMFYIIMAIALFLKLDKKVEILCILWLFSAVTVRLTRNWLGFDIPFIDLFILTDYLHLFIAGVMFYKLRQRESMIYHLIIGLCFVYSLMFEELLYTLIIGVFFVVFYTLHFGKLKVLNNRVLVFLGTISYSLYLTHQYIGYIIINLFENIGFINDIVIILPILVSIGVASFITFFIERPVQRFLKKKFENKSKTIKTNEHKNILEA